MLSESELIDTIARKIITDIEKNVDDHLDKYSKFTLNHTHDTSRTNASTSEFFELIGRLKDVSALGRKLLELSPRFDSLRAHTPGSPTISSTSDKKSACSDPSVNNKSSNAVDASSEDLLAALINSSSSDDFLVLSSSLESISVRDLILAALIHIKSHDCFTLSHDIHGVVMVLRRVKFMIINILVPKNQMELVAELLTSIGRYNEMNFVFDIFRDKNQFELLLSKGVKKTPELRIALFNYVKKHPEFYALVTLNFSMFREIAESLEASATNRFDKLIENTQDKKKTKTCCRTELQSSSNLTSVSTTKPNYSACNYPKEILDLCLIEMVDASDCFAKAGCYRLSNNCENKAKLIALQLALLSRNIDVLNIKSDQLGDSIAHLDSFQDANIVAMAYDYHLAWRQSLFRNVILKGNLEYLDDYCKKRSISSSLVNELACLYKQYICDNEPGTDELSRLKSSMISLIDQIRDVEKRCKLFIQYDFHDAKLKLMQTPSIGAHLRDLRLV